jgi:hypothetical protein
MKRSLGGGFIVAIVVVTAWLWLALWPSTNQATADDPVLATRQLLRGV